MENVRNVTMIVTAEKIVKNVLMMYVLVVNVVGVIVNA
tara:strand:+ start:1086 stop:1199 length:114 start_codon:yes stop_codon:yes gene_type:complete